MYIYICIHTHEYICIYVYMCIYAYTRTKHTHTHAATHPENSHPSQQDLAYKIKYIYIHTDIYNKSTCPRVSTETVPSFWVAAVEHQAIMAATNPVHAPAIAPIALQFFLSDINKKSKSKMSVDFVFYLQRE